MSHLRRVGLAIALHLSASPAFAADPSPPAVQAANPHINCTCRANGRSYALGERVCLAVAGGHRVAECRMQQNVTTWRIGNESCEVTASLR